MKTLVSKRLPCAISAQDGMALLLCLLFLTALALLGLSASAETVMQDMLASNLQETERAKQSALVAQHWAENWLLQLDGPAPDSCSVPCGGLNIHAPGSLPAHPEFENLSWWIEQGHKAGIHPLTGEWMASISTPSIDPPMWIIEAMHEIPPAENGATEQQTWYRVLARGSGRTKTGISVVESIIVRSWASIEGVDGTGTDASQPCPGTDPATKCGRVAWRELL
jgi:Tfp pilus assembly protein PilX